MLWTPRIGRQRSSAVSSQLVHHFNAGSSLPNTVLMIFWEPLMDATRPPTLHQSSRSFPRLHTWSLKRSVPGGWRIEMHTWLFEPRFHSEPWIQKAAKTGQVPPDRRGRCWDATSPFQTSEVSSIQNWRFHPTEGCEKCLLSLLYVLQGC